jgi:hypothetical protein
VLKEEDLKRSAEILKEALKSTEKNSAYKYIYADNKKTSENTFFDLFAVGIFSCDPKSKTDYS